MADEKIEGSTEKTTTRRQFAAKVAITVPAVAVLLSATSMPASAQHLYGVTNGQQHDDPNRNGDLGEGNDAIHTSGVNEITGSKGPPPFLDDVVP